MSRILRWIFVFFTVCTLLILCACSDKNSSSTDTDASHKNDLKPEYKTEYIDIVRNGISEWSIVYPNDCESHVIYAAELLANKIKIHFGVDIALTAENEKCGEKYIVIGRTESADVRSAFKKTRYYDYGVTYLDNCIVISAYSSERYLKAVDYFFKSISKSENDTGITLSLPKDDFMYSTKDAYEIETWTIGDKGLSNYRIVYERGLNITLVQNFRDNIAKTSGFYLDIMSDDLDSKYEYEILIGNTNRPESSSGEKPLPLHFTAEVRNNKLVIRSGGIHSLPKILDPLLNLLSEGKNEITMQDGFFAEGNLFDDPFDSSLADGADLRIMSCNILAELLSWSANPEYEKNYLPVEIREEIFFAALDYYKPTVVGLQELTSNWYYAIENNYHNNDNWELLKFDNPNRSDNEYVFSTVMYRSDLYELIDSGMSFYSKHNNARARCYTWAILKEHIGGKEFCILSTHWDGTGREHGFLQATELAEFVNDLRKRCPVFTTGDFNANENSNEFKQYLADCEINDAKYSALLQVNNIGSWHSLTKDNISWGSCDHITSTKESSVLKYQTLCQNEIIFGSDHCWLIADIKLGKV